MAKLKSNRKGAYKNKRCNRYSETFRRDRGTNRRTFLAYEKKLKKEKNHA